MSSLGPPHEQAIEPADLGLQSLDVLRVASALLVELPAKRRRLKTHAVSQLPITFELGGEELWPVEPAIRSPDVNGHAAGVERSQRLRSVFGAMRGASSASIDSTCSGVRSARRMWPIVGARCAVTAAEYPCRVEGRMLRASSTHRAR